MPSRAALYKEFIAYTPSIPAFGMVGFSAGHVFRNQNTGQMFVNVGNSDYSMHVANGVNWTQKTADLGKLPILAATWDLNATPDSTETEVALWGNQDFVLSGTGAVAGDITKSIGGGWAVATHGGATDAGLLLPPAAGTGIGSPPFRNPTLLTDKCPRYEQRVVMGAAIISEAVYAGLKLTATHLSATDNDQAYFLYDTGNTNTTSAVNWQFCTSRSGTDTFVDTGVVVAAATAYDFVIQIDGNRVPRAYINGALVAIGGLTPTTAGTTGGVTGATNLMVTAITLLPSFGVKSLATASAKDAIFRQPTIGRKAD